MFVKRGTTIWLAAFGFFLAACGGKEPVSSRDIEQSAFGDLKAEIREVIEEADREADILALVEQLEHEFTAFRQLVAVRRAESRALNANYDASREEFDTFLNTNREHMRAARERVSYAYMVLITATTPDEWESIIKTNSKAIGKLSHSLRSL